ncbi:alpha/beta hydrolase [Subtercola boreus]|uniref:Alpha/beta hydrolase n=1 Tax=Subtercola boreus TaxID=120213 RepID=A0A3E0VJ67_9MICO|nr:alpha/beta fold hydrolase [Subtercola boreus]RFA10004.1 alpha/beta hydrolase [Subtercola boreus]TQL52850.1 alpha-beta hydrolase superfamily lysophospholipase [Subtercola boreus]
MSPLTSTFPSPTDSLALATYRWNVPSGSPRAVVQLAHGVAEHSGRYGRLADALTDAGYEVHADDHRGHGASIGEADGGVVPLGSFGAAGWEALVSDMIAFGESVKAEHPDLPLFLIAHSMGSFAAQQMLLERSDLYAGVVLSGSTALDVLAGALAANAGDGPVELTAFNAAFEHRTGYEWLSRDTAEVDAYVADPLSGFDLADDLIPQLFSAAARLADPAELGRIRHDLPILVVSGQDDPLSGDGQLVGILAQRYRDAGLTDVTLTVYPGARHEIFNETNRDEITATVIAWLAAHAG